MNLSVYKLKRVFLKPVCKIKLRCLSVGQLLFWISISMLIACSKEKVYTYEVNPVTVGEDGNTKQHVKTTLEFISIAYSDLFGTSITSAELQKLNIAYTSFGDKKLIEDMIIRNFLNTPGVKIPTVASMKSNADSFVIDTYKKLFNRTPDEFEKYFLTTMINTNTAITPEMIYYSMMTSNEYRYY